MKIAAIIPARYHSTRFMGKPLALIAGKPMIERVYRQAARCDQFSDVIVATDDQRIAEVVERFGGHAVMTSPLHSWVPNVCGKSSNTGILMRPLISRATNPSFRKNSSRN